jgi:hypothetical protein
MLSAFNDAVKCKDVQCSFCGPSKSSVLGNILFTALNAKLYYDWTYIIGDLLSLLVATKTKQ